MALILFENVCTPICRLLLEEICVFINSEPVNPQEQASESRK